MHSLSDSYPSSPLQPSWSSRKLSVSRSSSSPSWLVLNDEAEHPEPEPEPPIVDDSSTTAQLHCGEAELVYAVVGFFRGYGGTIPSEHVQDHVRTNHPQIYATVVDGQYDGQWHAFIAAHPGTLVLPFSCVLAMSCVAHTRTTPEHGGNRQSPRRHHLHRVFDHTTPMAATMAIRLATSHHWLSVDLVHARLERQDRLQVCHQLAEWMGRQSGGNASLAGATAVCDRLLHPASAARPLGGSRRLRIHDVRSMLLRDPFDRFDVEEAGGDRVHLKPHEQRPTDDNEFVL